MFCALSGSYPKDMSQFEALHDPRSPPEPEDVPEIVRETVDKLVYDALPLIRGE
jgi:hypothetical protein